MNNYEKIIQGGIDALLDYAEEPHINHCVIAVDSCGDCSWANMCRSAKREWLEQEYVEPDSKEKLLNDIDAGLKAGYINACAYFGVNDCLECRNHREGKDSSCTQYVMPDIKARIIALFSEVEQ